MRTDSLAGGRNLAALGWIMSAAAAYDLAFGVGILLLPARLAAILAIPLPEDGTYLGLCGVLLLVLGSLYLLPARDPARFAPVIGVSAAGRLVGAAYLAAVWAGNRHGAFLGLAAADLGFAVVQAVLLLRARGEVELTH